MNTSLSHKPYATGGLLYLILTIFAFVFYKERTLWGDIPYHIFQLMVNDGYAIQNQRFGAVITQSPPLWAIRAGASMNTIAMIYSVTFAALYAGIFGLLVWMKNARMATVMLLLSTLMVADTFYWIQSELPQGLSFLALTFGILTRVEDARQLKWGEYMALLPLLIMLAYFHPLLIIPYVFITIFLWMGATDYRLDRRLLLGALSVFLTTFVLKNTLLKVASVYEDRAMSGLNSFLTLFPNYFFFPMSAAFFTELLTVAMIGIFIALLYYYTQEHTYKKIFLVIGTVLAYWLLVTVTHAQHRFSAHYMENLYLPLSFILGVPFVFDLLPQLDARTTRWVFMSLVVLALLRIASHRVPYTQRRYWQRGLLETTAQLPQRKLLIKPYDVPRDTLLNTLWSSPYEFWMLSQIEHPHEPPPQIIISDGSMSFEYLLYNEHKKFATYWSAFPYDELDCRYFNCTDTSYYVWYTPPKPF